MEYDCAAATVNCGTAVMLMRSVPNGTRDNNVVENIQDLRIGFEGIFDVMGGANWELNFQVVNNDTDNTTQNLVNKSLLQAGLDNFEVDPWGINSTLDEVAAQMLAFNHTSIYSADLKSQTMDFIMDFDIGELAGGAIGMVVGAEYNQLYFKQLNDPESNAIYHCRFSRWR